MPVNDAIITQGERMGSERKKTRAMPKFKSEAEEADWWASPAGREYVKQKSSRAESEGNKARGSGLVAKMNQKSSQQIAIRLPQADLAQARKLAERKGLGYQTLLKMLVHEGLAREARRG
jgi:predicted DNA binding CopG/RHH family protein